MAFGERHDPGVPVEGQNGSNPDGKADVPKDGKESTYGIAGEPVFFRSICQNLCHTLAAVWSVGPQNEKRFRTINVQWIGQ